MKPTPLLLALTVQRATAACLSSATSTTINTLLTTGGANTLISLCPGTTVPLTSPIIFTAPGQEISTAGYPTDSTRATLLIQPGTNTTSAIRGNWQDYVRVRNLQIDGNRPKAGALGGDALLEMGGGTTGQWVEGNVIRDTRSWSCFHLIASGEEGNLCRNATVKGNTVGPCGEEGVGVEGGLWADGLSVECTESEVVDNEITGATDGGIVIFGSPGSSFLRNTITSSPTQRGFGGINMVDPNYNGNYSGVVVSDNTIIGVDNGFIELGIAMGGQVWSNPHPLNNFGPTTVSNNVFKGNIGFSIVINGWEGGLTVQNNDISALSPPSDFADPSTCGSTQKSAFLASHPLLIYPPGAGSPLTIQPEFTTLSTNASNFLCLTHPLPTSQSFPAGSLSVSAATSTVVDLKGLHVQLQGDGNLVGLDTTGTNQGGSEVKWASGRYSDGCGTDGSGCVLAFDEAGELKLTDGTGKTVWGSGTKGKEVVFLGEEPWVVVKGADGGELWTVGELA
ncbi:hypothetical protein B0J18DRAFT_452194 [Chaetomium sp. MPI-SDFR-AT-0129]|nr:hypothetical protein B0J18DRAFT_452194 [Chaetomium sp. MPI-SDFR-AT-0129]